MINKSLRGAGPESSSKANYGFRRVGSVRVNPGWHRSGRIRPPERRKKEPPLPAAIKLITGRRQTEWTGATRCPNEDTASHKLESLIDRKRVDFFRLSLPCRPLAEQLAAPRHRRFGITARTQMPASRPEHAVGGVLRRALLRSRRLQAFNFGVQKRNALVQLRDRQQRQILSDVVTDFPFRLVVILDRHGS